MTAVLESAEYELHLLRSAKELLQRGLFAGKDAFILEEINEFLFHKIEELEVEISIKGK